MPKVKQLTISHTSLTAYRRSPQAFAYAYLRGLRLRDSAGGSRPMILGQCFHRFMELAVRAGRVTAETTATVAAEFPEAEMVVHAQQLAEQFLALQLFNPADIVGTELELSLQLLPNVTYVGHIDLLLRIGDEYVVVDYKTTSKHLAWAWSPALLPSNQGLGYVACARAAGYDCNKMIFQGVSTDTKLLNPDYVPRKRSGESAQRPPLFLDIPYYVEQYALDRWLTDTQKDAADLVADIEANDFVCCCVSGLDRCDFRKVCQLPPGDTREAALAADFTTEDFRGFAVDFDDK